MPVLQQTRRVWGIKVSELRGVQVHHGSVRQNGCDSVFANSLERGAFVPRRAQANWLKSGETVFEVGRSSTGAIRGSLVTLMFVLVLHAALSGVKTSRALLGRFFRILVNRHILTLARFIAFQQK